MEQPIAFMSKALRDSKLKYSIMEKQAWDLVQSLKNFKIYVGYSRISAYVPDVAIKDILVERDCSGIREKWLSQIREYDMEIKSITIIKGQCLTKMLDEGNEKALNTGYTNIIASILDKMEHHSWYADIIYYLKNLTCLDNLRDQRRRALCLRASIHCLIQGGLGWRI